MIEMVLVVAVVMVMGEMVMVVWIVPAVALLPASCSSTRFIFVT